MRRALDVIRIAATYVGTVIGAGFASGQELAQFFVSYGSIGIVGVIACGLLFTWLGSYILELGHRLNATGYHQILGYVCGRRSGFILDFLTSLFLFGGLTIMLAGAGTVGRDYFGADYNTGLFLMAIAVAITVVMGMKGISYINMIVTPLLVISTVIIGVSSLLYHGINPDLFTIPAHGANRPAPHWLLASLLYVSYNLVLGSTVLGPLGAQVKSHKARLAGGILGGFTLTILGLFITIVIMLHYPTIMSYEVPMLYVSNKQHGWSHLGYAMMLIKAMFSTAIASLYGCAAKLETSTGLPYIPSLVISVVAALAFSQLGFSNLIAMLYPVFGYMALWFTIRLIYQSYRDN